MSLSSFILPSAVGLVSPQSHVWHERDIDQDSFGMAVKVLIFCVFTSQTGEVGLPSRSSSSKGL